jgi:hypothetical protein
LEEAGKAVSATAVVCVPAEAIDPASNAVPISKKEIKAAAVVFRVFI